MPDIFNRQAIDWLIAVPYDDAWAAARRLAAPAVSQESGHRIPPDPRDRYLTTEWFT